MFLAPEASTIPIDFRQAIYCTVLANTGESEWNSIFELFLQSSNNIAAREDFLNILGCTKDTSVLKVFYFLNSRDKIEIVM